MKCMKNILEKGSLLLIMAALSCFLPAYSLTWKEFFNSMPSDKYNFPANAKNKNVTCWKKVYWEEYIEGNSYTSGYVKKYRKELKINCPY